MSRWGETGGMLVGGRVERQAAVATGRERGEFENVAIGDSRGRLHMFGEACVVRGIGADCLEAGGVIRQV